MGPGWKAGFISQLKPGYFALTLYVPDTLLNDLGAFSHSTQNCELNMNFLILHVANLKLREAQQIHRSQPTRKWFRNPPAEGFAGPTGKGKKGWTSTNLHPRDGEWGGGGL